jgi:hypothetical protein
MARTTWAWEASGYMVRSRKAAAIAMGLALLAVAAEAAFHAYRKGRSGAAGSPKLEIDALTTATPGRLLESLEITDISTNDALGFDPARGAFAPFSYKLSKPAWVRIRLVSRSDERLVLRTLEDWSARKIGKNVERWDGFDASGNRFGPPCRIKIEGVSAFHEAHGWERCGDPRLAIDDPPQGCVMKGEARIRISFRGVKRGMPDLAGYALRLYVDGELCRETRQEPSALGAFELTWETRTANSGSHLITVNVDDGNDHVGAASVRTEVRG